MTGPLVGNRSRFKGQSLSPRTTSGRAVVDQNLVLDADVCAREREVGLLLSI